MLATCTSKPFTLYHPDKWIWDDLKWWLGKLESNTITCPITPPPSYLDMQAFSNASTGLEISIIIRFRWCAWQLIPGWNMLHRQQDIGWAEAIGLELLVSTISMIISKPLNIIIFCNNLRVVEGWRTGRHWNNAINGVFKCLHWLIEISTNILSIFIQYIPSADNPADLPSCGIYSLSSQLLSAQLIPDELQEYIIDTEEPLSAKELCLFWEGAYSKSATHIIGQICDQQKAQEKIHAETRTEEELIARVLRDDWFWGLMIQCSNSLCKGIQIGLSVPTQPNTVAIAQLPTLSSQRLPAPMDPTKQSCTTQHRQSWQPLHPKSSTRPGFRSHQHIMGRQHKGTIQDSTSCIPCLLWPKLHPRIGALPHRSSDPHHLPFQSSWRVLRFNGSQLHSWTKGLAYLTWTYLEHQCGRTKIDAPGCSQTHPKIIKKTEMAANYIGWPSRHTEEHEP